MGNRVIIALFSFTMLASCERPIPFGEEELPSQTIIDSIGTWSTRSPLLTARQEMPLALLSGNIYTTEGITTNTSVSRVVEVYDRQNSSWSTVRALPATRHHHAAVAMNGRVYVIGGYADLTFTPTNNVYEYNPTENIWTEGRSLQQPRGGHTAAAFAGKIYIFGGITPSGLTSTTEVYDPFADSWRAVAPMPTAREHLGCAVIDSLIYVAGGRVGSTNSDKLEAYSPISNRWYSFTSMPTARSGLAVAAVNGKLYVLGGELPGVYANNEEFDPRTNSWRQRSPLPTPRHGMGAIGSGSTINVIGGAIVVGYGATNVHEIFTPR